MKAVFVAPVTCCKIGGVLKGAWKTADGEIVSLEVGKAKGVARASNLY
ncbi:MAG: hypothetical protein VB032_04100 [Burkholderiaceae bacterium]|nr:hypothetical protein [Burkholderiaceae bacterium]